MSNKLKAGGLVADPTLALDFGLGYTPDGAVILVRVEHDGGRRIGVLTAERAAGLTNHLVDLLGQLDVIKGATR